MIEYTEMWVRIDCWSVGPGKGRRGSVNLILQWFSVWVPYYTVENLQSVFVFFITLKNVHRYIQDTVSFGMAGWILRTKWNRSNSKSMPHSQQIYTIVTMLLAKLSRVCDGMRRLASVTSLFKQLWKHRQHSNWQHVMSSGKVEWVCVCVCCVHVQHQHSDSLCWYYWRCWGFATG